MPKQALHTSFFHQYTSAILIFLLFVSQTIQVSFFDKAKADAADYRDIVSIIVDRDTYASERANITRYASDIQGYLKAKRVSVFVAPRDARPEVIAAHNEKLYYEGDGGDGISKLVGTIIVGNVPLPVVEKEGLKFPSLYPYVDFDDKRFVYDNKSALYTYSKQARESSDVDIWHGVINPALGRDWQGASDIAKIGQFFDKTHDFYTRSGRFVPMTTPPRVFYYDGYTESLSADPATMYKYALYSQNIENIAYTRWSKYLLTDIMGALRQFQNTNSGAVDVYAQSLGLSGALGDDTMEQSSISKLPDIQTREPILAYLKKFYETINQKTLGDIQKYVHNAGRYNSGTTVRVDQGALMMTMTDEIARDTLKGANDALEKSIDTLLTTQGYARPITLFDGYTSIYTPSSNLSSTTIIQPKTPTEYRNYFFGREAHTIRDPLECTIARGNTGATGIFGRDILVEANVAYDINSPEGQIATLSGDTTELVGIQSRARNRRAADYACFQAIGGVPKLNPLYGGNSILRMMSLGIQPDVYFSTPPSGTSFQDFASPATTSTGIFSLSGMKETARLTPPSLSDCLSSTYQYTLLQPFTYDYLESSFCGDSECTTTCQAAYPDEWNIAGAYPCTKRPGTPNPRFSCLTKHSTGSTITSLSNALSMYSSACTYGTVSIDGRYLNSAGALGATPNNFGSQCIVTTPATESADASSVDNTIYQDQKYHTIPSLLHHTSPTDDEITAASSNGATPSLPIDIVRSVEFLTPKGGVAKVEYPNFFSTSAPSTTVADMRTWLLSLSSASWNPIITAEGGRSISAFDTSLNASLSVNPLPASGVDWNTLISDDVLEKIIQAKKWMNGTVTKKYNERVEASLSYSQAFTGDVVDHVPLTPRLSEGYEIAYLGLAPFLPKGEANTEDTEIQDYQYQLGQLQGLNFSEHDDGLDDPERKASAQCGPPEGVDLFKWPQAIACWAKSLFPIKITAGSCGGNTVGMRGGTQTMVTPPSTITRDSAALRNYYANGHLVYEIDRTAIAPGETASVRYYLDHGGSRVELPPSATVELDITNLNSQGRSVAQADYKKYLDISGSPSTYTAEGAAFSLYAPGPLATVTLRPLLTVPLPDGTNFTLRSEPLTVRVTDEYIDITPMVGVTPVATIDTTLTDPVNISFTTKKTGHDTPLASAPPYTLSMYDDVDGSLIESGITVSSASWSLPARYRNTIGVYRLTVTDSDGRMGDSTLAVRSGPLSRMDFRSISSTIAVGATSYGVLRLLDARDNLVSPTLHHLVAEISGGSFLDANGQKQSSLTLDPMESEIVFSYTSDSPGSLEIHFRVVDPTVETTANVQTIENPRVRLTQSAPLVAGGSGVTMSLEVRGQDGQIVRGFSSIATLDIPSAAGSFSSGVVEIRDGKSGDFTFTPGKSAGDHVIRVEIPGIGTSDHRIMISPGPSMYIDSTIEEAQVDFTLRDRYGNRTHDTTGGTLRHDLTDVGAVAFTDGVYSMPRAPGYWRVQVPLISSNTLSYTDTETIQNPDGTVSTRDVPKTLTGIPFYQVYVPDIAKRFTFLPDYNARYTVLAGDSYIREGSQILFDTSPGQSQSLAVTTLLSSPYERENLFTIVPGGGFSVGSTMDTSIETTLRSYGDTLVLDAYDSASESRIARVAYPLRGLPLSECQEVDTQSDTCHLNDANGGIMFVTYNEDTTVGTSNGYMSMITDDTPRVTYDQTTGLALALGVTIEPLPSASLSSLVAEVKDGDTAIGRIIVREPVSQGVNLGDATSSVTALTLDQSHPYSRNTVYAGIFDRRGIGYEIVRNPSSTTLDERLTGPNHIESLGSIVETPGVGWHDGNRSLLSFAAGDTVGDATKWFHTYTMVNLGDPVAHVDQDAPDTMTEGLDRSIGHEIASGADRHITSFKRSDMDGDGLEDIVIVYSDGFIELYQNLGGTFRKKQKIAYIPNLTSLGIELGDFTGDKYADIVALDGSGSLILYDNDERRITEPQIGNSTLPEHVSQFKVYDMDADGKDDIVYLTEGGELGILYGTATTGSFTRSILDSTLGVSLSGAPMTTGGVIRASTTPTSLLSTSSGGPNDPDEGVMNSEVFYVLETSSSPQSASVTLNPATLDTDLLTSVSQPVGGAGSLSGEVYVRNEYAPAYGLSVERSFTNTTASTLHAGDRIEATITIKNTGSTTARDVKYLDILPHIFELPPTSARYRITGPSGSRELPLEEIGGSDYDLLFRAADIGAGQTVTITYELVALPFSPGNMLVGNLEKGLAGDDPYGDVGFETSTTCGADMLLWASTGSRVYNRTTRTFTSADLPASLASQLTDADNDGVPDSVKNMSLADRQSAYRNMTSTTANLNGNRPLMNTNVDPANRLISIGLTPNVERDVESIMQNLANGLSCGFGGGGCLASPINWAPLAPGNDISVLGTPYGDGLKIDEGLPIFSALTGVPIYGPWGCFPMPFIWPPSPIGYDTTCGSNSLGAGGYLGIDSASNFLRIFVTPTLTMGMGAAMCFGGPARTQLNSLYPLLAKGNCIIITKPMNVCKGDGSSADGDVRGISGLGPTRDAWNSQSCTIKADPSGASASPSLTLTNDIISYLRNPQTSRLGQIYGVVAQRGARRTSDLGGPLVKFGDGSSSAPGIDISLDSTKPLTMDNIVKVRNRRISAFPEFIMDWFARQTEEMRNKFLTLPNLIIIPPKSFGPNAQFSGDFSDFVSRFSVESIKKGYGEMTQKMGAVTSNAASSLQRRTTSRSNISSGYEQWLDQKMSDNASTINTMDRGVNQLRAAYQFIGKLPFIRLEEVSIPINIPWLLPQDLDRYARSLKQYESELDATKRGWCGGQTGSQCLDSHTTLGVGGLESGIKQNLRRIEEWKRFPEKIQKYVTWKQRYIAQIICNIDSLERMLNGWYRDNGLRFKKWAEFWVLMQAIVKTWQPFLDIWTEHDRSCSVCQNQRWDLNYWKFKLLSAVIPQMPILQFPRWPDIVLDLSDIRFAVLFRVPEFHFQINPIRLPDLPNLNLPDMPSASLNLPGLPTIPAPPNLPNLPDLPSLPRINLPNLPPPPKLPKIFGAVSTALNIAKLLVKIDCYRNKTFLVPEDYAGATIAQRTDRQTTMPFDFLNFRFPQIAIGAWPREIRVSTHVNFEVKTDFLVEFAKSMVKPINSFGADFARMPKKIAPDININGTQNINLTPRGALDTVGKARAELDTLRTSSGELLDTLAFSSYMRSEMIAAHMDPTSLDRALKVARKDADILTSNMMGESEKSFSLLRDYFHAEEAETRELEKWIDSLSRPNSLLSDATIPVASFVSDPRDLSSSAYEKYNSHITSNFTIDTPKTDTFSRDLASVSGRLGRLLANHTGTPHVATPIASGYAPNFRGIYVLTPETKEQIRLFDYTDSLDGSENVDIVDIDKDGDDDYLYLLDGALYVKYGQKNTPARPTDTSIDYKNLDDTLLPEAPDFFSETIASPAQIEISFAPAHSEDRTFRLEFYDRYMEWDMLRVTGSESADTPRTIVDLTVKSAPTTPLASTMPGMTVRSVDRSLESVSDTAGFTLEGMRVATLTSGQEFSLSAGRSLYTGNSSASLRVTDNATSETRNITLDPYGQYTFDSSLSGAIISGRVYVLTPSGTERLSYNPDMRGMPLLPGSRLIDTTGDVRIYDPAAGISTTIPALALYRHISLGVPSDQYHVTIPYKNGFYSARLTSLRTGNDIHAGITLLAPLAGLDRSSPVLTLSDQRIPVYQDRELLFADIVSEMSPFALTADPDVTTDANGDGNYENDYVSTASGLTISAQGIKWGKYDTLGTHMMNMNVTDAYNNTTLTPLSVEVYAPVPKIDSVSSASGIVGSLDEALGDMPVHVFRVREGEGITRIDTAPVLTDIQGVFTLSSPYIPPTPTLTVGASTPSPLSSSTLLPSPSSGLTTVVIPATATTPLSLRVSDATGAPRYSISIVPPPNLRVVSTHSSDSQLPELLVEPLGSTQSIEAGLADPSIPGGRYIVAGGLPIAAIDAHGQIYLLDNRITLSPTESDGHIVISIQQGTETLARLTYFVDFFVSGK